MMRFRPSVFAFLCIPAILLSLCTLLHADPPSINYFFPSGGQRGTTVEVTANGSFPTWPLQAHVSAPGVQIEATDEKGKLKATIAEDARGGVYFVRLHDATGASNLRPFVVGDLPETNEVEPNDQPNAPQTVENPIIINGKLAKAGDVDGYKIKLNGGQTVVTSLTAHRTLKSPMDGVLQICDSAGFVIEQNDDELGFDPQLVFTAPRDGEYLVRTFAFPETPNSTIGFAGGDNYVYRLTITTGPYIDHTLPMAVQRDETTSLKLVGWNLADDQPAHTIEPAATAHRVDVFQPQAANILSLPVTPHTLVTPDMPAEGKAAIEVPIPSVITGRISAPKQSHLYQFTATKGEALHFRLEGRQLGYRIDPWLGVKDATGKLLNEVDDAKGQGADVELAWKAPADGTYQLQVRDLHDHGGERYIYRLTATKPQPDYQLSLAADTGIVAPDKPLELTINVTRQTGFSAEIDIAVAELPEGILCEPMTSAGKGDSAKTVKLKLTSAGTQAFHGPLKIIGKSKGDQTLERTATFAIGEGQQTEIFWLTALPKK